MTQKEIKEQLKLVPRFREVCCKKMCSSYSECEGKEDECILSCPWFFGYRIDGWPVKHLSDYSYNAPKFPDLRVTEVSESFLKEWKERRSQTVSKETVALIRENKKKEKEKSKDE